MPPTMRRPNSLLSFFPSGDGLDAGRDVLVFVGVAWWASSTAAAMSRNGSLHRRTETAVLATLFFNLAHYVLRPWPWILVALAALVLYPHGVAGPDGKPIPSSATCRRWSTFSRHRCGD